MAALDLDGDGKINSKELIAHQRKFGVKVEKINILFWIKTKLF